MIFENSESYMKKWKVNPMDKQESLKFLQSLIDEVKNGLTKEDIERGQKLMEQMEIDKEDPMTIQNEKFKGTRFEWEWVMPDGKTIL